MTSWYWTFKNNYYTKKVEDLLITFVALFYEINIVIGKISLKIY